MQTLFNRLLWDLAKIKEFNDYFNVAQEPISESWVNFRNLLYNEEYDEMMAALANKDDVELMDALCDMRYILTGTLYNIGFERGYLIDNIGQPLPPGNAMFPRIYASSKKSPQELIQSLIRSKRRLFMSDFVRPYKAFMDFADGFEICNVGENKDYSVFDACFTEVHRSNMSKGCLTEEEAKETCESYIKRSIPCYYEENHLGHFIVRRGADGKVLKSIKWSEPKIELIMKSRPYEVELIDVDL